MGRGCVGCAIFQDRQACEGKEIALSDISECSPELSGGCFRSAEATARRARAEAHHSPQILFMFVCTCITASHQEL